MELNNFLDDKINFLISQHPILENMISFYNQLLDKKISENELSYEQIFETLKFLSEYHTNTIILISELKNLHIKG